MENPYTDVMKLPQKQLQEHIEEFACAFAKHTGLPPDKIVMKVEQFFEGTKYIQNIWFEKKETNV